VDRKREWLYGRTVMQLNILDGSARPHIRARARTPLCAPPLPSNFVNRYGCESYV
jgi:hypothetical protein